MDDYAEDLPRVEQPVPVVEVEGTSVPDSSPPVPRRSSHPSTSLSLLGIYWLLWKPSAHLLPLLHLSRLLK